MMNEAAVKNKAWFSATVMKMVMGISAQGSATVEVKVLDFQGIQGNIRTFRTTKGSNIVMACLEKSHNFHSHVALVWSEIPMTIFITVAVICAMKFKLDTVESNT